MQTFLPYADFRKSAKCLDNKRLGKQRVEAMQILNVLTGKSKSTAWQHHPAVLMWKGYEKALSYYLAVMLSEWVGKGFRNTMKFPEYISIYDREVSGFYPPWIGSRKFHASHRSNLLRKDKSHYSQFKWKVKDNLPYYWPVRYKEEK
jgi:hypothetical protein